MAGADRMTIEEVVGRVLLDQHADVIGEAVKTVAGEMMELEVSELIGAERGERRRRIGRRIAMGTGPGGGTPVPVRSSCRSRRSVRAATSRAFWSRAGAQSRRCWPWCSRRTSAASPSRRVDQLVESLGLRISRSEVSRVCAALDEHVEAFGTRPLAGRYPYLCFDAKVEKVRDGGRVVNKALVVAHGIPETGRREILSIDVGEAETEAFWTDFLRGLVARGLIGVQLAISDAHAGLKAAINRVLGCAWQRCTVHFLRDCLGHAPKDQQDCRPR